jgi:hypothetical protein
VKTHLQLKINNNNKIFPLTSLINLRQIFLVVLQIGNIKAKDLSAPFVAALERVHTV